MTQCYYKSDYYVNCLDFHPAGNILTCGSINGDIEIFKLDELKNELVKEWSNSTTHSNSVRISTFSSSGSEIMSASADKTVAVTDVDLNKVKWVGKGHKDPVNSACYINDNLIITGDDEGEIRIWDNRIKSKAVSVIKEFEDCITDLLIKGNEFLVTCGDQIGCFDAKKYKMKAISDNTEHEFLTMSLVKDGKKVLCGTATGSICLFSYGYWGDFNDIIPVNKETVNKIVKLNEDVVCTCGDDGEVYVVDVLPNRVIGKLKDFKGSNDVKSTDSITINDNKTLIAFLVNFEYIHITDTTEVEKLVRNEETNFFDEI
ncbi:hypothetical protein MACK_001181 [Theileria orientalis]|uniref:Uncharacterized protein n=1 Tax=Theileria orientalis TaxID=68886 RepID=A0A976MC27_THEOR|nr:hypothetical protein MACK_001181 [Theileria orientalis]